MPKLVLSEVRPGAQKISLSADSRHGWEEMEIVGKQRQEGKQRMERDERQQVRS